MLWVSMLSLNMLHNAKLQHAVMKVLLISESPKYMEELLPRSPLVVMQILEIFGSGTDQPPTVPTHPTPNPTTYPDPSFLPSVCRPILSIFTISLNSVAFGIAYSVILRDLLRRRFGESFCWAKMPLMLEVEEAERFERGLREGV